MIIRITAPHFVAGIVREQGKPCRYAPIVKWMAGMKVSAIKNYCRRKKFKCEVIE